MPDDAVPAMPMPTEPAGRVPAGLACKACGYELTGLSPDGVCPECAHPVVHSLRPDLLRFHDATWLARVERGLHWIARGVSAVTWGVIAVIACVPVVMLMAVTKFLDSHAGTVLLGIAAITAGVLLAAGPCMLAAGSLLAGSTHAGAGGPVPMRAWPATLVRWGGACFAIAVVGSVALEKLAPTWDSAVQLIVKGACQGSVLVCLWALVARLEDLESRTIDWSEGRAKRYRSHRRDLVVAGALYVIFGWVVAGPGPRAPGNWGASFAVLILLFFYNTTKAAAEGVRGELHRARVMAQGQQATGAGTA